MGGVPFWTTGDRCLSTLPSRRSMISLLIVSAMAHSARATLFDFAQRLRSYSRGVVSQNAVRRTHALIYVTSQATIGRAGTIVVDVRTIGFVCRGRREIILENLALRHRREPCYAGRGGLPCSLVTGCSGCLGAVSHSHRVAALAVCRGPRAAETVLRWHREWLRQRWTRAAGDIMLVGEPSTRCFAHSSPT
jgi:hypothetical protein